MTAEELTTRVRELVEEAKEDDWIVVTGATGALTFEKQETGDDGENVGAPQRIAVSLDSLNAPSFEDQLTEPSDQKTASESPPGPPQPDPDADTSDSSSDEEPEATDAAQERADELDVDISTVDGTGKDGRVTVGDVEKAAE